ncbi:MAG: hypothetical protein ACYC96_05775 [Fimbriimonadaceae bacterium]
MPKGADASSLRFERTFLRATALAVVLVLLFPIVLGYLLAPAGTSFLGFPYNTDDHMVYAAWMRQAMAGHFLFDNRFTTDPQPGLTIHVYFFLLGQVARLTGIAWAAHLARISLAIAFTFLLFRLIKRLGFELYTNKLALILAMVGGGLGFLAWHDFGTDIVRSSSMWVANVTGGKLPTDVWQPEGYVFPSLLTNSLFALALCLIVTAFLCVLRARESDSSWGPVIVGALAVGVLMNVHSYDVLLVALVLVGLLATAISRRQVTLRWLIGTVVIGLGALPAALWFVHVVRADAVFAARADTPTYTAGFRAVVVGYLPLLFFGYACLAKRCMADGAFRNRRMAGFAVAGLVCAYLIAASLRSYSGYMLSLPEWIACFVATLAALMLMADEEPTFNLFMAWALVGIVAIYFPGLFQRKLAMGLAVPWAILSGTCLAGVLKPMPRSTRNFATAVSLLLCCASSIEWLLREERLLKANVAETTVQPVYLQSDLQRVLAFLNALPDKRTVVVAMPGIPSADHAEDGSVIPDSYSTPIVGDFNPILSGMTGVYTYAGHWSETPDYVARRERSQRELFSPNATPDGQRAFLASIGADYVLAPVPGAIAGLQTADMSSLGDVAVRGSVYELIAVRR